MTDFDCEAFRAQSAELALGILDGRERAETLVHLERCPGCRQELRDLADVADELVELIPLSEPSAGFESRVLASIRAASPGPAPKPSARAPLARSLAAVAAAVAVVVGIGIGGFILGHHSAHHPQAVAGAHVRTADFVNGPHHIGQVITTTGAHRWIYMSVDSDLGSQTVTCQVHTQNNNTTSLGSFQLVDGYGYWASPVPDAGSVTGVQLVDAQGRVLATASYTTTSARA
ncbi:MAG: hypothetical protein M3137_04955 [Actinomycetota bacterium]|nr:hypothetical protein [Actinomycetota bacterium]